MKIYTTGYGGRTADRLPELAERLGAIVADIRFAAYSKDLQWRKNYLELLLRDRYIHVPALGNRNYRDPELAIQIHNLELGVRLVESWQTSVILMCGCRDPIGCHRRLVGHEFETRGYLVEEVDW